MKILKNVLTKETLEECSKDLHDKSERRYWYSNHNSWAKSLLQGTFGICLVSPIDDKLKNKIVLEIENKTPKAEKIIIQHYIWLPGSGISPHHDQGYVFGMTIYLCDIKYEDGGILIWKNGEEFRAYFPEYNSAAINEKKSLHMVTPVSLTTKKNRHTIQIWGI